MGATAVITGASAGIGRALAFEFARRGYNLGLTARRQDVLEELRTRILAAPGCGELRIELSCFDVAQEDTVGVALRTLFTALGGIDIVIANAGVNDVTHVGQGDLAKEARLIRTNVIGAIATVDAAVEHFLARGRGQVVGISSLASLQPMREQAAYCASKAAFSMYLKSARHELKTRNITVTDMLPGFRQDRHRRGRRHRKIAVRHLDRASGSRDDAADRKAREIGRRAGFSLEARATVPRAPARALRKLLGTVSYAWVRCRSAGGQASRAVRIACRTTAGHRSTPPTPAKPSHARYSMTAAP